MAKSYFEWRPGRLENVTFRQTESILPDSIHPDVLATVNRPDNERIRSESFNKQKKIQS